MLLRLFIVVISSFLLTACRTEPDYPLARIDFEPALLGTWEAQVLADDAVPVDRVTLVIERRDVPVNETRVNSTLAAAGGGSPATTPAYRIRMLIDSEKPVDLEFNAYLVKVGGTKALGLQVSDDQLNKAGGFGWVLPVHRIIAIRCDGDSIAFGAPADVGWIPESAWLDGQSENPPAAGAGLRREEGQALLLTNSIDRLLAEYDAAPDAKAFQVNDEAVFKRTAP